VAHKISVRFVKKAVGGGYFQPKGPKPEAHRAESVGGILGEGEGREPPFHLLGGLGEL